MKHLFVVNPLATRVRGRAEEISERIKSCFSQEKDAFDIHTTRWCRDAVGFVRRYVLASDEVVRVHSVGGSGTLFEVVNGVFGLHNAEVAAYPFGSTNSFIQYFMRKNIKFFENIKSQISSDTVLIDAISDGASYGVAHLIAGIEAEAFIEGSRFGKKVRIQHDLWPKFAAFFKLMRHRRPGNDYRILIDDNIDVSGRYVSIMSANTPCYQKKLNPAVDAHPNDGVLDVYTVKSVRRLKYIRAIPVYTSGGYEKMPDLFSHYPCKKISIECDNVMRTSFDGEILFAKKIEFSVVPGAVKMVVPREIDLSLIPEKYQG